jgi:hypothetical protein
MTTVSALALRVAVPDVWDIVHLAADDDWTVAKLKTEALGRATGRQLRSSDYIVKFRGARVVDELVSLRDLGVPDKASLIVLPARRQPVR